MKEKLRSFFDSKSTWAAIGLVVGSWFGADVAQAVGAVGQVVMAVL